MHYGWVVTTEPTEEPVGLDEAKAYLRVTHSADDPVISALVRKARETAERVTGKAIVEQTRRLSLSRFPLCTDHGPVCDGTTILPPGGYLQSVSSITYVATDGTVTTLASTVYDVDTDSMPGRIVLAYAQTWPIAREQARSVKVNYVCGWDDALLVPRDLRDRILEAVAYCYDRRSGDRDEGVLDRIFGAQWVGTYG